MSKHTEGPWTRKYQERFHHDNSAGIRAANGLYIAAALDRNSFDLDDEVEANACLIAAAPDLLAACEASLKVMEEIPGYRDLVRDAESACRAAIARAHGTDEAS
jgi:hypothetical protein